MFVLFSVILLGLLNHCGTQPPNNAYRGTMIWYFGVLAKSHAPTFVAPILPIRAPILLDNTANLLLLNLSFTANKNDVEILDALKPFKIG